MARRQYPFHLIEPKWQARWEAAQAFRAFNPGEVVPADHPFGLRHGLAGRRVSADTLPPKFYILDMFPYPSGAGLHVGHPEGYTATDILARYRRARGFHVLHPMGWDAFGLPAEQYAIKTGQHPRATTEANIATFKRQIQSLGFSYDWSREVDTTDPGYFRWTQWIFLQLYKSWFNPETNRAELISTLLYPPALRVHPNDRTPEIEARRRAWRDQHRLAYVSEAPVNWCPELGTVLANEEVIDGKSEVGGFPVLRRPMRQWMLRITAYAERLLDDLDTIDWSDSLKEMQRNWIGRSEGAEVDFQIADAACRRPDAGGQMPQSGIRHPASAEKIRVFTTRPDTLFGATYMVLAPEHRLVDAVTTEEQWPAVREYRERAARKSDLERTELAKEKTGVFTGAYAINPVNGERIPIWIADYVLISYGTGAIMAVPAHDTRDFEFATRFNLPIVQVVQPPDPKTDWRGFVEEGTAVNSTGPEVSITGLPTAEAKIKITTWLESKGLGKKTINYKLRDWLFSRQRYWGEPFPIVWKQDALGNSYHEAVGEHLLPVLPPGLEDYKPTADGRPPLARAEAWVTVSEGVQRETNTMPQWAGSCWYYLRYLDAQNPARPWNNSAEAYWMGGLQPMLPRSSKELHAGIERLVQSALFQPRSPRTELHVGLVTPRVASLVQAAVGVDVRLFTFRLDTYGLRHAYLEHRDPLMESRRGQRALRLEDFHLLPAVYAAPDSVEDGGLNPVGRRVVRFVKRFNGAMVVAEEVLTGRGCLALQTCYIREAGNEAGPARDTSVGVSLSTSDTDRLETELIAAAAPVNQPRPGIDLYVGGTEHAVLHLLYARFWHKVLYDLGHVSTPEPFYKLVNQGLILGEDGQKMSKSRGNVVNPDDILKDYGADAFRLYEMFMGPLEMVKPWSTRDVAGVYRFLGRVWRLFVDEGSETAFEQAETTTAPAGRAALLDLLRLSPAVQDAPATPAQLKVLHACIKKVTEDLDGMRFNTAISAMMVFTNEAMTWPVKPAAVLRDFLILLQPFAPHLAEELWEKLCAVRGPKSHAPGGADTAPTPPSDSSASLPYQPWPGFDPAFLLEETLEIPVQVNGRLRDKIVVPASASDDEIKAAALKAGKAQPYLAGKEVKKVILVPKKLVNIAVA